MAALGETLREAAAKVAARGPDHLSPEWRAEYQAYLASPEWRIRRLLVLERATDEDGDTRCERCGWVDVLQVHHMSYTNFGHEPLHDLLAACPRCHPILDAERVQRDEREREERNWRARVSGWRASRSRRDGVWLSFEAAEIELEDYLDATGEW